MDSNRVFAGVDCSAGAKGLTVAALSPRLEVKYLRALEVQEAAAELSGFDEISVAIGGPLRANASFAAEADIRKRGILIRRSPAEDRDAPASARALFGLARELSERGFLAGAADRTAQRFLLSTRPAACGAVLLGRIPFARATLEGRIQRQLLLVRERMALPDPMDSLEELTAHHLLSGRLSLPGICEPEELDALLAAFTAWRAFRQPEAVSWLGRDADGWICLPAKELLDKYLKSDYHG
jgi:hypothetical protein